MLWSQAGFPTEKFSEILLVLESAFLANRCYVRLSLTEQQYGSVQFVIVHEAYKGKTSDGLDFLVEGGVAHCQLGGHRLHAEVVFRQMLVDYLLASHKEQLVFFQDAGSNGSAGGVVKFAGFFFFKKFLQPELELFERNGFQQIGIRPFLQRLQKVLFGIAPGKYKNLYLIVLPVLAQTRNEFVPSRPGISRSHMIRSGRDWSTSVRPVSPS